MIEISYDQYDRDISQLCAKIPEGKYSGIYGIPRGGYYPAIIASQITSLPIVASNTEINAATLVIDDLCDSGRTISKYQNDTAVVYCKEGYCNATYYGRELNREWIKFPDEKEDDIEHNLEKVLQYIGEDVNREGLIETPKRMRRAYDEIFGGYKQSPEKICKLFSEGACSEPVYLIDCEYYSTCEHHFLPFYGVASIAYIPGDRVIGVSKLARIVDCYARRLQIQERMTAQIADAINQIIEPKGVLVYVQGQHFCMKSRGVQKSGAKMITVAYRGEYCDAEKRNEAMGILHGRSH